QHAHAFDRCRTECGTHERGGSDRRSVRCVNHPPPQPIAPPIPFSILGLAAAPAEPNAGSYVMSLSTLPRSFHTRAPTKGGDRCANCRSLPTPRCIPVSRVSWPRPFV